jgi:hypothetical protein
MTPAQADCLRRLATPGAFVVHEWTHYYIYENGRPTKTVRARTLWSLVDKGLLENATDRQARDIIQLTSAGSDAVEQMIDALRLEER